MSGKPTGGRGSIMTGGDWSVGIGSSNSLTDAKIMRLIGARLREGYEAVLEEGIPAQFTDLVDRLARGETAKGRARRLRRFSSIA
jgi:hypothetical protein